MKTIQDLRKACKQAGIKLAIKTLSWGKHATFTVGGISASSVTPSQHYQDHRETYEALDRIKREFNGNLDEKVFGLKP